MEQAAKPNIPETYAGRCVLITGATGFIGKVLVEKIVRCCPGVKRLYLLIRPGKTGDSVQKRLENITKAKLFDKLREDQDDFARKIIAVKADLLQPKLGLSDEDIKTLQENVSIVFHVAATIKFNEALKLSLQLNVTSVQMLLDLCRGMDLHSFVHVSTAYSNCPSKHIEEKVYPLTMDPYKLLNTVDWMTEDMVNDMTPFVLGDWPNTYTFTKAIAETVILKESVGMPVCIVRPSIVGASWRDPIPGWVDNLAGASGLFIATHSEMIASVLANEDMVADITPVDLVVNTLITSAWHTAVNRPAQVPVINLVTSPNKPITWKQIATHICPPTFSYTENNLVFGYLNFFGCKLPFTVCDLFVKMVGKRARMMRTYNQILKSMHLLKYFTCHEWVWSSKNYEELMEIVPESDKRVFFMDSRPLDWREYLHAYIAGVKQFVLKEDPAATRRNMIRVRVVRWIINTVLIAGLCRVLMGHSQMARNVWYLLLHVVFQIVRFVRTALPMLKAKW